MATVPARSAPRVLGLTGPIACGKSTVGSLLLELGALDRIDADEVVHDLMGPGSPVTEEIQRTFGTTVILPDGAVDRPALGEMVFSNGEALRTLEAIVHPAVRREIRRRLDGLSGRHGVVVVDAVKLLQSELLGLCDGVWVVRCSRQTQLQRLTEFRHLPPAAAQGRLAAQPSFEHPRVTTIIENSESREHLRHQVMHAWAAFLQTLPDRSNPA